MAAKPSTGAILLHIESYDPTLNDALDDAVQEELDRLAIEQYKIDHQTILDKIRFIFSDNMRLSQNSELHYTQESIRLDNEQRKKNREELPSLFFIID